MKANLEVLAYHYASNKFINFNEYKELVKDLKPSDTKKLIKQLTGCCNRSMMSESAKTEKSFANVDLYNFVMYLAPYTSSGIMTCLAADNCIDPCLFESGRAKMEHKKLIKPIKNKRILRTWLLFANRELFNYLVNDNINSKLAKLGSKNVVFRLNGTSDLTASQLAGIYNEFPHAQFIEYTKVFKNLVNKPDNVYNVFSFDNNKMNILASKKAIAMGKGLAVCFSEDIFNELMSSEEARINGVRVVNGDLFDTRNIDRKYFNLGDNEPYIIALKFKPTASIKKGDASNHKFIIDNLSELNVLKTKQLV